MNLRYLVSFVTEKVWLQFMKQKEQTKVVAAVDADATKTNNDYISLFSVSKEQLRKLNAFSRKHVSCQRGAIGGAHTYEFSPTSLGVVVKLRCHCGKSIDVTDYCDW